MSAPWGSGLYGIGYWGEGNEDATVTFEAWGQGQWGIDSWGIGEVLTLSTNINSVSIAIGQDISVTGEQLNSTVNTVSITGDSNLNLSTNLLQISLGDESGLGNADVVLTALAILNTTIGAYSITADGNTSEIVVGDSMSSATGTLTADAGASFEVTGNQANILIGDEVLSGNATVNLSTNLLNVTTGTASGDVATVILTGSSVVTTTGTVTFTIDGSVTLTGVNMTTSTGRLFVSAWAVVDIGVTNNWAVVDIAA